MRISQSFLLLGAMLLALVLLAPPGLAQSPHAAPATSAPAAPLVADEPVTADASRPKARRPANPLYPQIVALLHAEKGQIAALRARLAATRDSDAAASVQREIEQIRTETEVGILRLQAEHARKTGRPEVADGIDAAIRQMTQPPLRVQPAARRAPAADVTSTPTR